MTGLYLRKSPEDKKETDSIENQREVVLDYAQRHGLTIDAEYKDEQTSGYVVDESMAFFDREDYNRMMKDIRDGKLHMVLIKDFTRLGRHAGPFLIAVEQITKWGCKIIDCTYSKEISPSDDKLIFDAYFSERYVRDVSNKVRETFKTKQKNGSLVMNNKFGYIKVRKVDLIVDEEIRPCIVLIFTLYIEGYGFQKIADYLNEKTDFPTPSQYFSQKKQEQGEICKYKVTDKWRHYHIQNIIDNRIYTGCLATHKKETDGIRGKAIFIPESKQFLFPEHHEAIISEDIFNQAQEIRKKRNDENYRGGAHYSYIFSGFCVCPDCGYHVGGTMIKRASGHIPAYNCSQYIKSGKKGCKNKEIREDVLLEQFKSFLLSFRDSYADYLASTDIKAKVSNNKKMLADNEVKLKKAKRELINLVKQKSRATVQEPDETKYILLEAYGTAENECKETIVKLTAAIENLKTLTGQEVEQKIRTALESMDAIIASPRPDRRLLEALLDKIIIHPNRVAEFVLKVDISESIFVSGVDVG